MAEWEGIPSLTACKNLDHLTLLEAPTMLSKQESVFSRASADEGPV